MGTSRYGTVMTATLTGPVEELLRASQEWAKEYDAPGFLADEILVSDDGSKIVTSVFFSSREDYQRLADDPRQDAWWTEKMAPYVTDVTWIDGTWQQTITREPAHA